MDLKKFKTLPYTNIGKMIGDIENLDWIDFENLEDDITIGTSIDEREFLVIKYQIESTNKKYLRHTQCFYQAYKKNNGFWISNINTISFINTRFGITPYQKNLIERLINGEIVIITPNHYPCETNYIGKRIATLETWKKEKAAKIIQKNWRICRYDPKYKMCETVLMNNIEEAREEYENTMNSLSYFQV